MNSKNTFRKTNKHLVDKYLPVHSIFNLTDAELEHISDCFFDKGGTSAKRLPNRLNIRTQDIVAMFSEYTDAHMELDEIGAIGDDEVYTIFDFYPSFICNSCF